MASRDAARAPVAPPEKATTVADVVERFIEQHVEKVLRRPGGYVGPFRRLVIPAIGSISIRELRRSHIADMLDGIAETSGEVTANRTLTALASCLHWYGARDDEFTVPVLSKLRRKEEGRERIVGHADQCQREPGHEREIGDG